MKVDVRYVEVIGDEWCIQLFSLLLNWSPKNYCFSASEYCEYCDYHIMINSGNIELCLVKNLYLFSNTHNQASIHLL